MREEHFEDFGPDLEQRVGGATVSPVRGDSLAGVGDVFSSVGFLDAEERHHGRFIRRSVRGWEKLVQKRGRAIEQDLQGAEEEIRILGSGVLVPDVAVIGEGFAVAEVVLAVRHHVGEEGGVEAVVVAVGGEVVVAG